MEYSVTGIYLLNIWNLWVPLSIRERGDIEHAKSLLGRLMLKLKLLSLATLFFLALFGYCYSDTLYFKNGKVIQSDTIWEENGFYMYKQYGATVGIRMDKVESVEISQDEDGFQFDVWSFGISVSKAISIAENHDTPLHRQGIISMNKSFHPMVWKHSGTATRFYYNTNLLGHFAKVELYFTPISKSLHTVRIVWPNQRTKDPKLTNEIFSMISDKYGDHQRKGNKLFYKATKWITEDSNQIELQVHSTSIALSYLHTEMRQLDFDEAEDLKVQKIQAGAKKDKGKF